VDVYIHTNLLDAADGSLLRYLHGHSNRTSCHSRKCHRSSASRSASGGCGVNSTNYKQKQRAAATTTQAAVVAKAVEQNAKERQMRL